mgnify:CR=1 FL=1
MAAGFEGALIKLQSEIEPLLSMGGSSGLIAAFSYFFGVVLAVRAAYKLKLHSDNPAHNPVSSAGISFLIAACFLSLPQAAEAIRGTLGLSSLGSSALAYTKANHSGMAIEAAVYVYAAFFGYIAVIRGLFLFNKMGEQSKRGDELGRGMTHLVGGVCATNLSEIVGWLKALFN